MTELEIVHADTSVTTALQKRKAWIEEINTELEDKLS